jgi:hypothetical protein
MLSLAFCAIVVARVVCPCASVTTEHAKALQPVVAEDHACCGKSETPIEHPSTPCQKQGSNCIHCGTQLAPSDKTVDVSQISVAPALLNQVLVPFVTQKVTFDRAEPRLVDPSPPSLLSLHCVLVI